jgi:Ran GTPase-activating protein (RanGAP) involved in mRNA processing and transport
MNLSSNQLEDEGAALLAAALRSNRVLLSLDLRNNNVSDAGAVALAECLQANCTLTELQLNSNWIGARRRCQLR